MNPHYALMVVLANAWLIAGMVAHNIGATIVGIVAVAGQFVIAWFDR